MPENACSCNRKGFTLVELIVVLAILAVLLALLIPHLLSYLDQGRATVCASNRAALIRQYNNEKAEDSTVTISEVLADYRKRNVTICPDGNENITADDADGTLRCARHSQTGSLPGNTGQLLDWVKKSYTKDTSASMKTDYLNYYGDYLTVDQATKEAVVNRASGYNTDALDKTLYWRPLLVNTGTVQSPDYQVAMIAKSSTVGWNSVLLFYDGKIYYHQNGSGSLDQGSLTQGIIIEDYLPGGKSATGKAGWEAVN